MKKIILVGHSHTNCIYRELLESFREEYSVKQIHIIRVINAIRDQELKCSLEEAVVDEITKAITDYNSDKKWFISKKEKDINIVLLFGGSFHNILGLIKTHPPFDFISEGYLSESLDDNVELVPLNVIKSLLKSEIVTNEGIVKTIKNNFDCNIFHLGFPPPLKSNEIIMENIEDYFKLRHENPVLACPNLRYKLWKVFLEMYCEMYARYEIPYAPVPQDMIEDGFLMEKGFSDSTHANNIYANNYIEKFKPFIHR